MCAFSARGGVHFFIIDRLVSKILLSMLIALLLPAETGGIYVYGNLNINAFEPSCVLLCVEKS